MDVLTPLIFFFLSLYYSNCPFSLAAALARATADSVLQSDLSIYHIQKTVEDGVDPFPRESPVSPRLTCKIRSCTDLARLLKGQRYFLFNILA